MRNDEISKNKWRTYKKLYAQLLSDSVSIFEILEIYIVSVKFPHTRKSNKNIWVKNIPQFKIMTHI